MDLNLEKKLWWHYIEEDLQELLVASEFLCNVVRSWGGDLPSGSKVFHDYSFIVFPAAKAYEGFLKKLLGKRYTIHKDIYEVKFARQTNEGEDIFVGAHSMKLYFNGISHYGNVEWPMNLHRSFLKKLQLPEDASHI